jgi:uncharacterized protein YhaN
MRLQRLLIENYGCFARAEIPLAVQPGCVNLVVAPNGAGKSVLRQAFHDLLFDIPLQSPMKFRFGYKGMRLQADALTADGTAFTFGWTRDAKPSPRITSDPARFAALRAHITPEQLQRLFALDTEALRRGGLDLKGGTTLAGALLSGTGELLPARQVQTMLDARRNAHWGQGKSKPPLNAAAAELVAARKAARDAAQRPELRERQAEDLAQRQHEQKRARDAQSKAQEGLRRLNRIALTRPHLEALEVAETWFSSNPDAPALPPTLEQALADARSKVKLTESAVEAATLGVHQANEQRDAIPDDDAVAAHAVALAELPEQTGKIEKALADKAQLERQHDTAMTNVVAALRKISADVPPERAGELVPALTAFTVAREAISRHTKLAATLEATTEAFREARGRLDRALAKPSQDTRVHAGLDSLVAEIRTDRNPLQHAEEAAKAERTARAALDRAQAMVPGWSQGSAALAALAPRQEAAYERLDAVRHKATADAQAKADANEDRVRRLLANRNELAALRESPLPDNRAIAVARARRDEGWRLLALRLFDGAADQGSESAHTAGAPLPLVFERDLRMADSLADRRIAELDRVNTAERLAREGSELELGCAAAAKEDGLAGAAQKEAAADWAAAVAPLGLEATSTMADVRAFLASRTRVVESLQASVMAQQETNAIAQRHAAWAVRLVEALGVAPLPLPALLSRADSHLETARAAFAAEVVRTTTLTEAETTHQLAAQAHNRANQALQSWRQDWVRVLADLGRPPDEAPAVTDAVLDCLHGMDADNREATNLAGRIAGIQGDHDGFAATVIRLAESLGEVAQGTALATARALSARWTEAARQASARLQAERSLVECTGTLSKAQEQALKAAGEREAVIAAAGGRDEDDAAQRIALAREYIRHAAMRDDAAKALALHGDGLSIPTLHADARAVPPEAMVAATEAAKSEERDSSAAVEKAAIGVADMQRVFDADAEITRAQDAAAAHAAAAARFGRLLEEQLVLQFASAMLRQGMAAIEQEAGDKGLARISKAFASVTAGAYGVVLNDEEDGALRAVELAYPHELKLLEQLSEGTRDQLYLALRMVALRDHAEAAEPMPFIADDILQTFDNTRAAAAIAALVALSQWLQVIILTHHEHLAALTVTLPQGCINIHRL